MHFTRATDASNKSHGVRSRSNVLAQRQAEGQHPERRQELTHLERGPAVALRLAVNGVPVRGAALGGGFDDAEIARDVVVLWRRRKGAPDSGHKRGTCFLVVETGGGGGVPPVVQIITRE